MHDSPYDFQENIDVLRRLVDSNLGFVTSLITGGAAIDD